MRLMYLSQEAIDDIKMNFNKYKLHFTDDTNEWFMQEFKKNGWIRESKIECRDFELNYDEDFNVSDRKNIEIVYEALKDLSPVIATDERLWAGMLFGQFWDFVKYRRGKELASGKERDVLNSFFFLRSVKRSCVLNCLSRLWWTGFLFYDEENTNHYAAIDLISEKAYSSNILLMGSNNFVANKKIALGVLDCIAERKKNGEKIVRDHFVQANKYLNCIGGIAILDTLTREEAKAMANSRLESIFA